MSWNWELPQWPKFNYDLNQIVEKERLFLLNVGRACGFLNSINEKDYKKFVVEILSSEGVESSKIEGEMLDRESLQSSIKHHFGLQDGSKKDTKKESNMAKILCDVYENFAEPLSHGMLFQWHAKLFKAELHIEDKGKYRTHTEPMQIVSHRYGSPKVFFEAPPSRQVPREMDAFINWYNAQSLKEPLLIRAAIAHLYFECIHPFEDGNGRIGRLLVEKTLSQGVGRPILIAVSKVLEKKRKEYYAALEKCNHYLEADNWIAFFSHAILQAQQESTILLYFLIEKSKLLNSLAGQLNPRQEKVLIRMFAEGPDGFKGGLSAENYLSIAKTSRATATRDLAELVYKGALVKTGELRYTRYWLNIPKPPAA